MLQNKTISYDLLFTSIVTKNLIEFIRQSYIVPEGYFGTTIFATPELILYCEIHHFMCFPKQHKRCLADWTSKRYEVSAHLDKLNFYISWLLCISFVYIQDSFICMIKIYSVSLMHLVILTTVLSVLDLYYRYQQLIQSTFFDFITTSF